jgi:ribosomal peptide maturation radical SAM protein 1
MDVVLVVMPFADVGRPAMGVGLLAAEARRAGYRTTVEYFGIDLAERIGLALYQKIASSFPPEMLVGEWFFADDVFGADVPHPGEYIDKVFARAMGADSEFLPQLVAARHVRSGYLDDCARAILAHEPKVVGFTTTFHQTCACLAVARRLKQAPRPPLIVFGGANCEGEMGLQMIRSFEWIDFVCCGESDVSFPRLLGRLFDGGDVGPIPGVLERGKTSGVERSEPMRDMDSLPFPDFDGYFDRLARSTLAGEFDAHLVFETSRGCWWGAKHHCTFCGLNGDTMAFRSKSPERVLAEIDHLVRRHGARRIGCVDNILDMRYVETLFPRLEECGLGVELFYEVKANLRHAQLATMRRGGVREIQPGIESFSDEVLSLMDKGCTGFQNIQLMRWSEELDVKVAWNLLAGFPGESPAEYRKMAELIPLLTHLAPPYSCAKVRLDRFSPFHARPDSYGFRRIRPAHAYYYVFPLGRVELSRIAYYFDFDYEDGRQPDTYILPVQEEVRKWWAARLRESGARPRLDAHFEDGRAVIEDSRPVALAPAHELRGLTAAVYARCDVASRPALLARALGAAEDDVLAILEDLRSRRLVAEADGKYLSLAVFRRRPPVDATSQAPHHAAVPKTAPAEPLFHLV